MPVGVMVKALDVFSNVTIRVASIRLPVLRLAVTSSCA